MGKHGLCPLSVAPLRQRIVRIPITPPQCGLSPKETRPSCAAADCCYCACCSSPHRSVCCCFCCRSPSLSHRPKHDRPARDDDPPRPASVHHKRNTLWLPHCATRSATHPTCPEFCGLPPLDSKPQPTRHAVCYARPAPGLGQHRVHSSSACCLLNARPAPAAPCTGGMRALRRTTSPLRRL